MLGLLKMTIHEVLKIKLDFYWTWWSSLSSKIFKLTEYGWSNSPKQGLPCNVLQRENTQMKTYFRFLVIFIIFFVILKFSNFSSQSEILSREILSFGNTKNVTKTCLKEIQNLIEDSRKVPRLKRVRVKESILLFRQGCGTTLGVQPRAILHIMIH